MKAVSFLLWGVLVLGAPAQTPEVRLPPGTQLLRDLPYVTGGTARQKLDLYVPANARGLPLVVWIHGGGWQTGTKDAPPALGLLWKGGYAVASLEYRFSSDAIFPAQIEDAKAAIRWLRTHAAEHGIDPNRIGVWGFSAGGHLAALLGTSGESKAFDRGENLNVSSRVQAVCDFSGPIDLTKFKETRDSGLERLLGGPVSQRRPLAAQASPLTYVSKAAPPFLIVHGERDELVPPAQGKLLEEALKRVGADVTFHVCPGAGHDPQEAGLNELVGKFFDRTLRPK
jgi:acetyl esterase/lipase